MIKLLAVYISLDIFFIFFLELFFTNVRSAAVLMMRQKALLVGVVITPMIFCYGRNIVLGFLNGIWTLYCSHWTPNSMCLCVHWILSLCTHYIENTRTSCNFVPQLGTLNNMIKAFSIDVTNFPGNLFSLEFDLFLFQKI